MQVEVNDKRYLLVKRGLYYRPNGNGYTGIKEYAGRYLASDAMPNSGVIAIHEDEAPAYSEACYSDLMAKHASEKVRTLEAQIAELRKRIGQIENALMRGDDAEAMALTDLTDYSAALQHKEPQG
jgi:hypothetical protein